MKVIASGLQLRNIGQLARVTTLDGVTVMGRLNEVASKENVYALVIGGSVFEVPGDHPVDIRRSANLDALVNISDDISEGLEADNAA
jgi:hypothetical protein